MSLHRQLNVISKQQLPSLISFMDTAVETKNDFLSQNWSTNCHKYFPNFIRVNIIISCRTRLDQNPNQYFVSFLVPIPNSNPGY